MYGVAEKLRTIQEALCSIAGLSVYHYYAPTGVSVPYCEWMEDGEYNSHHSDNHKREQVITGMVHYYTKTDFDGTVDEIQNVLNSLEDFCWSLNSVQYEDTTGLIHYAWDFEVV